MSTYNNPTFEELNDAPIELSDIPELVEEKKEICFDDYLKRDYDY